MSTRRWHEGAHHHVAHVAVEVLLGGGYLCDTAKRKRLLEANGSIQAARGACRDGVIGAQLRRLGAGEPNIPDQRIRIPTFFGAYRFGGRPLFIAGYSERGAEAEGPSDGLFGAELNDLFVRSGAIEFRRISRGELLR